VIINTRWNVVAKEGLVIPILSSYTQQDAFTLSKNKSSVISSVQNIGGASPQTFRTFVMSF
jgi:hypothetical protein